MSFEIGGEDGDALAFLLLLAPTLACSETSEFLLERSGRVRSEICEAVPYTERNTDGGRVGGRCAAGVVRAVDA